MKKVFAILVTLASVLTSSNADAAFGLANTSAASAVDYKWTYAGPGPVAGGNGVQTFNPPVLPAFTNGWLANSADSEWISPTNSEMGNNQPGLYTWTYSFNIDIDPSLVAISGRWASDNGAELLVNGGPAQSTIGYGVEPTYSFGAWTSFTLSSGFVAGDNTLTFLVTNGNGDGDLFGPTGLRVEFTNFVTPEPTTLVTWGVLGLAAAGVAYRRRKA